MKRVELPHPLNILAMKIEWNSAQEKSILVETIIDTVKRHR
ncbi:hypothetical protein ACF1BQ_025345 [Bradyrhizobium sp. RDT10]